MDAGSRRFIWVLFLSLTGAIGLLLDDNITKNIYLNTIVIIIISFLALFFLILMLSLGKSGCSHDEVREISDKNGNPSGVFQCTKCNSIIEPSDE